MTSYDLTPVWEALCHSHVLLLVDVGLSKDGYDVDLFNSKVDSIFAWFSTIVKTRAGSTDFCMQNGAWLFVRPLVPVPFRPHKRLKVLVLK